MTTNYIGNLSTIIKWISMTLAGWTIGTLTAYGLNLPIDTTVLSQIIFASIMLIIGYIDAKYPNTFKFLGNEKLENNPLIIEDEDLILNEEYECLGDESDGC